MNLSVIATHRYRPCFFQFLCFINAIIRLVLWETEEEVTTTILLHETGECGHKQFFRSSFANYIQEVI